MLAMDPRYSPYYPSPGNSSPTQQHPRSQPQSYARSSDTHQPPASPPYSYTHAPASLSGSGVPATPTYHHGNVSGFPQPHASSYHSQPLSSANALPPLQIAHGQGYSSRDVNRHDVPSGFAVPSLGQTLHELPFTASRSPSSSSSANRHSGNWGAAHPPARTPPLYDRQSSYPPPRHGSQHPSLSQSTHLIPTPAQTAQTYHGYPHHPTPSPPLSATIPVVATIPPASSSSPPQERYYCDKCDKSFGRAHDKKRHYESTHLQQAHTCRFCSKTFSRNDSLKRHQDNGCDKDPEFNP
uniref:C2H2-type domain-containing protein n=1 Tax=Ganoderma boninense TaxID=34458 RepID=A0A5K1JSY4_9APHY|nr:Uncharacterized protein [Ganoderma boninense]